MKTLLLTITILLTGCVDIPDTYEVNHTLPIVDQCGEHGGMYDLDILANQLVCNDGAVFNLYKGE